MLLRAHCEVDVGALALDDVFQTTHASSLLIFWPDEVVERAWSLDGSSYPTLPPTWLSAPRVVEDFSGIQSSSVLAAHEDIGRKRHDEGAEGVEVDERVEWWVPDDGDGADG